MTQITSTLNSELENLYTINHPFSKIHPDWYEVVTNFIADSAADKLLRGKILKGYYHKKGPRIFPESEDIYNAYQLGMDEVKVIIIGQDPYHGKGQAHGLAFSTLSPIMPPSLKIIFKELKRDLGIDRVLRFAKENIAINGSKQPQFLGDWADQGVMLLNTVLTVQEGKPNSHKGLGWEALTSRTIKALIIHPSPKVFVTWGKQAQSMFDGCKNSLITNKYWKTNKHLNLRAPHPASDAYGGNKDKFIGCSHFSKINEFLETHYNSWGIRWGIHW